MDISNCFDNIDQIRLLAILEDILKSVTLLVAIENTQFLIDATLYRVDTCVKALHLSGHLQTGLFRKASSRMAQAVNWYIITHTRHAITPCLDEAASFSKFGRKSRDIRPGSILIDQVSIPMVQVV